MLQKEKQLSATVQEYLLTQLSQLLEQGYSFNQGLQILSTSSRGQAKQVLQRLETMISNGHSLPKAFEHCAFSPDVLVMIAQAELHGNLGQALVKASEWKRRQIKFRAEIRKALTYPTILLAVMIMILFLLIQFVIPQFIYLFYTYNLTLPWTTQLIVMMFYGVGQYFYLIMGLFFLCIGLALFGYKHRGWRERVIPFIIRIPGFNKLIQTFLTIMFCTQLGYMLYAHLSLYQALVQMAQNNHTLLGKRAQVIADQLLRGNDLSTAIQNEIWFVPELPQIIFFAEKNGQLGHQLIQYGRYLESFMVERWLARLKWIEPALLTIVGVVTAYLFVALFMPVFQILEAM